MRRLLALLAVEVGLVGLVQRAAADHRSALVDPVALQHAPAGDLVLGLLHVGAWLAAWWLLLGTAYDLVRQVRLHGRGRRRVAPRWVQRVVGQAVGTAMAVGVVAGPAVASTDPQMAPALPIVSPPVPPLELPAAPAPSPSPPSPTASADGGGVGRGEHVVAAGENLWVIARQQLVQAGAPQGDRDVHAHWVQLIRLNVDGLRSGDPDLVHPGEVLRLPPIEDGA